MMKIFAIIILLLIGVANADTHIPAPATNMVLNPSGTRLYAISGTQLTIINTTDNMIINSTPFAGAQVAFNPFNDYLYVTTAGNGVEMINSTTLAPIGNIPVNSTNLQGIAVNPVRNQIYVCDYQNDRIVIINSTGAVSGSIPTTEHPFYLSFNKNGTEAYVSENDEGILDVIDAVDNKTIKQIGVYPDPYQPIVTPSGAYLYVADHDNNYVSIINTSSLNVTNTLFLPKLPNSKGGCSYCGYASSVAFDRYGLAYVLDHHDSYLFVVNTTTQTVIGELPLENDSRWGVFDNLTETLYVLSINSPGIEALNRTGILSMMRIPTLFVETGLPMQSLWNVTYDGNSSVSGPVFFWNQTKNYPVPVDDESCDASGGYIYCVGGPGTNTMYFAKMAQNGTGEWMPTNDYPTLVYDQDCNAYGSRFYCVGGIFGGESYNAVRYTNISASGAGEWENTTPYPIRIYNHSCVINNGYLYCVGGTSNGSDTSLSYFAPITGSGVGTWHKTSSYPFAIDDSSCSPYNNYIYCVGGRTLNENSSYNHTYYAPLSASGIGKWAEATPYPNPVYDQACTASTGYLFCIGGYGANAMTVNSLFYAQITTNGLGAWEKGPAYPYETIRSTVLVSYGDDLYVIGGYQDLGSVASDRVFYTSIGTSTIAFSTGPGISQFRIPDEDYNGTEYLPDPASGSLQAGNTLLVRFTSAGASASQTQQTLSPDLLAIAVIIALAAAAYLAAIVGRGSSSGSKHENEKRRSSG